MPTLNQSFLSNVHYMDDTGAAGMSLAATTSSSKTYSGTPGNPSPGYCLDGGARFGVQAVWTGAASPVGSVALLGSNDNVTFTAITGSSQAVSGAGSYLWGGTCDWKFLRVGYTRTSGGGGDTMVTTIKLSPKVA